MHALNETRNSARYQPAWTCRQKRPWNLAKKLANADYNFWEKTNKQTNKKTTTKKKTGKLNNRGFKNFLEVLPWNQAVTLQILFLRGISWWRKVETRFPRLIFWQKAPQFMTLIFPFKREGRVSRHPWSAKAKLVTQGNLYANEHATCDLQISSPVTVS